MKKILLIALGSVVPLVGFSDTVSYERRNCYTSVSYNSNIVTVYRNVDCNRVKNHIKSYNQTYANSDPIRQKSIVGDIQGLRDSSDIGTIAYEVEVRTRPNPQEANDPNNDIVPDYPETLPDFLQDPRPDTTYYAPDTTNQVDDQIADSVTTDLTGNISEGADSRIQNQLQTAQFQFRKSSCENSDQASINNCYRTSQDGAIQKTGAD